MKFDRQLVNVTLLGAIGGVLTWVFSNYLGHDSHISPVLDGVVSVLLGAGAGMVFVYLIANTDRNDNARLLSLALLAGFFWEPVWEGGRALVDRHREERQVDSARRALNEAQETARSLASASGDQRTSLTSTLSIQLARAAAAADQIRDIEALTDIQANVDIVTTELGASNNVALASAAEDLTSRLAALETTRNLRQLSGATRYSAFASREPSRYLSARGLANVDDELPAKLNRDVAPDSSNLIVLTDGAVTVRPIARATSAWVLVRSAAAAPAVISLRSSSDDDLIAALYDASTLVREAIDDDSGTELNPELRIRLAAKSYLLRVRRYDGDSPIARFTVSRSAPSPVSQVR
jgi:hypothetical protein